MPRIDPSPSAAVADIQDGATIMVGGFGGAGVPDSLVEALVERGVKRLTLINNHAGLVFARQNVLFSFPAARGQISA